MLELMGSCLRNNRIFTWSQIIFPQNTYHLHMGNSDINRKNLAATTLTHWSKRTPLIMGQTDVMGLLCDALRKGTASFPCVGQNVQNLNLIMWKHQLSPNWEIFYKITDLYSSKISMSWNTKNERGPVPEEGRIKRPDNQMQCMIQDFLLLWEMLLMQLIKSQERSQIR